MPECLHSELTAKERKVEVLSFSEGFASENGPNT
jgi:hypothetical protein